MMAEQTTLQAEPRAESGKRTARRLRRDGFIPAVVYGPGKATDHLKIRTEEFVAMIRQVNIASTVIGLRVDSGRATKVLVREIQKHPFRSDILHIDFFRIREDEKIRVAIPVHLLGTPQGVTEGGILQQIRHELNVECLPGDIPDAFEREIHELVVGDSLHVGDIDTGDVIVLDDVDLTVCTVVPPTVEPVVEEEELEEGEEGEEGAEPSDEAAEASDGDSDEG